MKLHENGAYLIQGKNVVIDSSEALKEVKGKTGKDIAKNEAKQNTIAYNILKNHNTSGNMEKLQIKFDKLTSHDITFVGIIQTARAYCRILCLAFRLAEGSCRNRNRKSQIYRNPCSNSYLPLHKCSLIQSQKSVPEFQRSEL